MMVSVCLMAIRHRCSLSMGDTETRQWPVGMMMMMAVVVVVVMVAVMSAMEVMVVVTLPTHQKR